MVKSGRQLAKQLAVYRRFSNHPEAAPATRERTLNRISVVVTELAASELKTELESWLADEHARIAAARAELRFSFGTGLAAALSEMNITPRGQFPVVRIGSFSLRADFEAGTASLYWGPEVERLAAGIVLAPEAIIRAIRAEQALLCKRALEPRRLTGLLHQAYRRWQMTGTGSPRPAGVGPSLSARRQADGRAPVIAILGELVQLIQPDSFRADPIRRRFVEYPRVQFSHDLYRMRTGLADIESGAVLPRLHVATFDSTTSKTRALWVPDNEQGDGTNYSYLSYPDES